MTWRIEFAPDAGKQLSKIDRQSAQRIIAFLRERVAKTEDPRQLGSLLKGVLREFWRFRVGHYRVLTRIEDDRLLVLVVRLGHRKTVYR